MHPGVFAGVETRGVDAAVRPVWGGRGGGYVHPGHHTAVFALAEGGLRMTPRSGALHVDLWAGLGLHHRWVPRAVVTQKEGELRTRADGGRPNALGSLQLRVGDRKGPVRPYVAGELWLRGPVNGRAVVRPVLSVGVVFGSPS